MTATPHRTGAFDMHRPPDHDLISDCVHCGFCLPACPTYVLWGEEMDSPRGRIRLMDAALTGDCDLDEAFVAHMDNCLGCMACVTACPSGVRYDRLIEQTRAQVERGHRRRGADRALRALVFGLFAHPERLHALRGPLRGAQRLGLDRALRRTGLLDRLAPSLAAMERLTPALQPAPKLPELTAAQGVKRATVAVLTGCVQREFFGDVNAATVRVLAAEGCEVIVPPGQGCCGALSAHSGREPEAQRFAQALLECFEDAEVDAVVVNSAGCGSAMKEYEQLLDGVVAPDRLAAFRGKIRDFSELLVELGPVAERHPLEVTVAYHDACHLGHAQGLRDQPRDLLRGIPGVQLREVADGTMCCGSAGVYNILHPQAARELGDRKASNVLATGADLLVTANPGCLMQIGASVSRAGRTLPAAHLATVLDASLRGADVSELIAS